MSTDADQRIARIRAQLRTLHDELAALEHDLATGRSGPGDPQARRMTDPVTHAVRALAGQTSSAPTVPFVPDPTATPPGASAVPPPPRPVRPPRTAEQRDLLLALVLSLTGAAVLLVGVVLLLLGGASGTVPPAVAGVAATTMSAVLLGLGLFLRRGRTDNPPGAVAMTGAGFGGLFLTVAAMSTVFGWLSPVVALAVVGVVAVAGLVLAHRWEHQPLAVLITLGGAVLAPVVSVGEPGSSALFLAALAAAMLAAQVARRWFVLLVAGTVPAALVVLAATIMTVSPGDLAAVSAAATALAVVGVVSLVLVGRRSGLRVEHVWTVCCCAVVTALPLVLLMLLRSDFWTVPVGAGLAAVAAWVGAVLARRRAHARLLVVLSAVLIVLVLNQLLTIPLTSLVLAVALAHLVLGWRTRFDPARFAGQVAATVGLVMVGLSLRPALDVGLATIEFGVRDVVAYALAQAVVVLLVLLRLQSDRPMRDLEVVARWLGRVLPGAALLVAGGTVLGRQLGHPGTGFLLGHLGTTVAWVAVGVTLLLRIPRHHPHAQLGRVTGMTLISVALMKLFAFDLSTLDGLIRLMTFLLVGVLLVVVGVLWTSHRRQSTPEPDEGTVTS